MIEIIPAVMPKNFRDLERSIERLARFTNKVQIDVMDGKFVLAKSWPYVGYQEDFDAILAEEKGLPHWETIDYEIDLMVSDPEKDLNDWIVAGASRIILHIESSNNLEEIIRNFRNQFPFNPQDPEIELGLAINIDTQTDELLPFLEDVDFVQFMGIQKIGFQGQQFDEAVLNKIRDFHNAHPEIMISIDGGVTLANARIIVDAGVKRLVSGSTILESIDVSATIEEFKKLVF